MVHASFICKKYLKTITFAKKFYASLYFVSNVVSAKMFFFTLMLIVINARFEIAYTKMYEEPLPQEFKDCLNMILPNSDLKRDPAYIIDYACANKFLTSTPNKRWAPEKDEEEFTLITNKINKLDIHTSSENVRYEKRSIQNHLDNRHKKRSAVNPTIRRKEYRRMSPEERTDFHRALQLLKDDAEVIISFTLEHQTLRFKINYLFKTNN